MNGVAVIDASLAVKWLLNEADSEKAFALANYWARTSTQPVAPYLMPVEVANVLHRRVVQRHLSIEMATRLLEALLESGIEFLEPSDLHSKALDLANRLQQGAVYDAHYLALAESIDCELWTADQSFYRTAVRSFARVKWLGTFGDGSSSQA